MSHYDVIRSPKFFANTFDRNELETWGWCHSVRLVKAQQLTCNITYLGHTVTLTWRDLRSNCKINLSRTKKMDGSGLTRGRLCFKIIQNYSSSLSSLEVIQEKHFPKNVLCPFGDLSYLKY